MARHRSVLPRPAGGPGTSAGSGRLAPGAYPAATGFFRSASPSFEAEVFSLSFLLAAGGALPGAPSVEAGAGFPAGASSPAACASVLGAGAAAAASPAGASPPLFRRAASREAKFPSWAFEASWPRWPPRCPRLPAGLAPALPVPPQGPRRRLALLPCPRRRGRPSPPPRRPLPRHPARRSLPPPSSPPGA